MRSLHMTVASMNSDVLMHLSKQCVVLHVIKMTTDM